RPRSSRCQARRRETYRSGTTQRRTPAKWWTKRRRTPARRRWKEIVTGSSPNHKTARTKINSAIPPIHTVVGNNAARPHAWTKCDLRSPNRRGSKNDGRIIHRHIDYLRIRRLDLDDGVGHKNRLSLICPFHDDIGDDYILFGSGLKR